MSAESHSHHSLLSLYYSLLSTHDSALLRGGEGGIRTPGTLIRGTHDFQSCTFNRSVTSPRKQMTPRYLEFQMIRNYHRVSGFSTNDASIWMVEMTGIPFWIPK